MFLINTNAIFLLMVFLPNLICFFIFKQYHTMYIFLINAHKWHISTTPFTPSNHEVLCLTSWDTALNQVA